MCPICDPALPMAIRPSGPWQTDPTGLLGIVTGYSALRIFDWTLAQRGKIECPSEPRRHGYMMTSLMSLIQRVCLVDSSVPWASKGRTAEKFSPVSASIAATVVWMRRERISSMV